MTKKSIPTPSKHIFLILVLMLCGAYITSAQTATDGFMMKPKKMCTALQYNHYSFGYYWEGTLFRENKSLGRVYNHQTSLMAAYGTTKNLNIMVALPYVSTNSYSTFMGHRGLQDASLGLKYRMAELIFDNDDDTKNDHNDAAANRLMLFGVANYSMPVSKYYPDYLPLSIGLGSKNLQLGGTLHYLGKKGLFSTLNYSYTLRSNITIERDSYYTDRMYYTNVVDMPNVANYNLSVGYKMGQEFRATAMLTHQNTLGGADIRRNDMPFPSHNMDATRIGAELYYRPNELNNQWGIMASGGYTIGGRNVGQAVLVGIGITYQNK